jgi:hypothetical protein
MEVNMFVHKFQGLGYEPLRGVSILLATMEAVLLRFRIQCFANVLGIYGDGVLR